MKPKIEVTSSARGFHTYGDTLECTYGNQVTVVESSAAKGPHVWLFVDRGPTSYLTPEMGRVSLHLDVEQVEGLIARLQAWRDEIPSRWKLEDKEEDEPSC
jgi:hypothetical protein